MDTNEKELEPVKIVNCTDVKEIGPPEKKVSVLEIDENETFGTVKCTMSPSQKPGDLAKFTKMDQNARKESNLGKPANILTHKASKQTLELDALEKENGNLCLENNALCLENNTLCAENISLGSEIGSLRTENGAFCVENGTLRAENRTLCVENGMPLLAMSWNSSVPS